LCRPIVVTAGLIFITGGTVGGTMNAAVHGRDPTVALAHILVALIVVQMIPVKTTRAIQTFVLKTQRLRCAIIALTNV
jgi:broad specificity polyphosphatase/5'/3'-nucleotidase SurE